MRGRMSKVLVFILAFCMMLQSVDVTAFAAAGDSLETDGQKSSLENVSFQFFVSIADIGNSKIIFIRFFFSINIM